MLEQLLHSQGNYIFWITKKSVKTFSISFKVVEMLSWVNVILWNIGQAKYLRNKRLPAVCRCH